MLRTVGLFDENKGIKARKKVNKINEKLKQNETKSN